MDAGFQAGSGFGAAVAVCQEGLVIFLVGAREADDLSSDEEALGGYVDPDLFVTAADGLQKSGLGGNISGHLLFSYQLIALYLIH